MPRTRSLAWSELKIGLLTIVAIVIAAVLVFSLTGAKGWFWQRYTLKTRFPNVAGLAAGSPVRVAGVQVGSVKDIVFAGEQVDVVFEVNKDVQRADHRQVDRVSRLGVAARLERGRHHADDDRHADSGVRLRAAGAREGAVRRHRRAGLRHASTRSPALVRDLRQGKGTAGKLITDDRLYNELQQFVATAGQMTREIQQGRGTLGKLLKDPKAAESLEASLKNIEDLTRRINAGEGSLGKLLKDEEFAKSLNGATDEPQGV